MSTLAVIVITRNEADNIGDCLAGAAWADELIVIDSQSTDATVEIARRYTDQVYIEPWRGYAENKTMALSRCHSDWVFWLDADERITAPLAEEIRRLIDAQPAENGFRVARKAYFLGRWIRHCGWYPGYVLRLFRRSHGRFNDHLVHEGVEVDGACGRLRNSLLHYTDRTLERYLEKFNRYTTLAAQELHGRGRRAGAISFLLRPLHQFVKMYVIRRGFLDGAEGLALCLLSAHYVAAKYAKLWELSHCAEEKK